MRPVPPAATLSDVDVIDCSSDTQFSVRLLCGFFFFFFFFARLINQTGACDWWHCVGNKFVCPGLNCTGRQKDCGVWKKKWEKSKRVWGNERWSKQNERSGLKTTHEHWRLGQWRVMQKDTDHRGNEEFDCFLFDDLALKDQSNYSCKWSLAKG